MDMYLPLLSHAEALDVATFARRLSPLEGLSLLLRLGRDKDVDITPDVMNWSRFLDTDCDPRAWGGIVGHDIPEYELTKEDKAKTWKALYTTLQQELPSLSKTVDRNRLYELLTSGNQGSRSALFLLGTLRDTRVEPLLIPLLDTDLTYSTGYDTIVMAAQALSHFQDVAAEKALIRLHHRFANSNKTFDREAAPTFLQHIEKVGTPGAKTFLKAEKAREHALRTEMKRHIQMKWKEHSQKPSRPVSSTR
jgi:hypothetical protein